MQPSRKELIPQWSRSLFQRLLIAAVAAGLLAGCGGGPGLGGGGGPSESDSLTLSGTIKADSASAKGSPGSCQWTPALFDLKFASSEMQNSVRVRFSATVGVGGVGDIDAVQPAGSDGSTPLQLVAGGKTIAATEGTVHVSSADLTAKQFKGSIEGTFADGTQVSGTWACTAA